MAGYSLGRARWMDPGSVDLNKVLDSVIETKGSILLVDIGGGTGHDIKVFHK
jgi:hypothetical protein